MKMAAPLYRLSIRLKDAGERLHFRPLNYRLKLKDKASRISTGIHTL